MPTIKKIILIFSLFLSSATLFSKDIDNYNIINISKNPTWLRLLHYNHNLKSDIKDQNFFLAKDGNISPKHELLATINAYNLPFDNNSPDKHAQCKYPARYFWLSKQIHLVNYHTINPKCKKLLNWKLLKNTKSISVVFVSGFLGNPASAFGHSFLKINKSDYSSENLFDTSISFGALLPKKYNMLSYIYNGITGGYFAAYTDKFFYNQDITYSDEDMRDMWEYRLNFSDNQKKFLLLHTWELMTKKFQYFFTNRNCGYRVAKLLELVTNHKLTNNAYIWYAPVETFYYLDNVDKVVYLPSKQRKIYAQFNALNNKEKELISHMINKNLSQIPNKSLPIQSQINILNFLIDYNKYKYLNKKTQQTHEQKIYKRKLFISRLKLPSGKKYFTIPKKRPISQNNKPRLLSLSYHHYLHTKKLAFEFSPFAMELIGQNNFSGDELVVLDTSIFINKTDISLNKLDLIRIQRLKTQQLPFEKRNPFSWNLRIGTYKQPKTKQDYFIDAGTGFAWNINNHIKFYTMLNISAHTNNRKLRYIPNMGLFINLNKFRANILYGYEKDTKNTQSTLYYKLKIQQKIQQNISLYTEITNLKSTLALIGIKYFF